MTEMFFSSQSTKFLWLYSLFSLHSDAHHGPHIPVFLDRILSRVILIYYKKLSFLSYIPILCQCSKNSHYPYSRLSQRASARGLYLSPTQIPCCSSGCVSKMASACSLRRSSSSPSGLIQLLPQSRSLTSFRAHPSMGSRSFSTFQPPGLRG